MDARRESLKRHDAFFVDYQEKFADNFVRICSLVYPSAEPGPRLRALACAILDNVRQFETLRELPDLAVVLRSGVALDRALCKTFQLLIHDYSLFLFGREEGVTPLRQLVDYLEEYLEFFGRQLQEQKARLLAPPDPVCSGGIIRDFARIASEGQEIRMHNPYKGIIITGPVTLLDITEEAIRISITASQGKALSVENVAFFTSPALPNSVMAELFALDADGHAASFSNFLFVEDSPEKRAAVRVQPPPEKPVEVWVYQKERKAVGTLRDISVNGISLLLLSPVEFDREAWLEVRLRLENYRMKKVMNVVCRGRVFAQHAGTHPYRLVAVLQPDSINEAYISQYVAQRQIEIIRDVRAGE